MFLEPDNIDFKCQPPNPGQVHPQPSGPRHQPLLLGNLSACQKNSMSLLNFNTSTKLLTKLKKKLVCLFEMLNDKSTRNSNASSN